MIVRNWLIKEIWLDKQNACVFDASGFGNVKIKKSSILRHPLM